MCCCFFLSVSKWLTRRVHKYMYTKEFNIRLKCKNWQLVTNTWLLQHWMFRCNKIGILTRQCGLVTDSWTYMCILQFVFQRVLFLLVRNMGQTYFIRFLALLLYFLRNNRSIHIHEKYQPYKYSYMHSLSSACRRDSRPLDYCHLFIFFSCL